MKRKLDKEHLESIRELKEEFAKIANIVGNIHIDEYSIEQQLESIKKEKQQYLSQLDDLRKKEENLLSKLKDRYGEGQINIGEGTFIPS